MIKNSKRLIVGIILTISAITIGGRIPYFIMYFYWFFILLPIVHCMVGRIALKGVVKISDGELLSGEEINISYNVKNRSFISYPMLSIRRSFQELITGDKVSDIDFYLGSNEELSYSETIKCKRRGHYKSGEVGLIIKDMSGKYTITKNISAPISLKVYPKVTKIRSLRISAREAIGDLHVNDKSFEDYSEISTLRKYVDGDHIKKIHWKASQKTGKYMVKCYEPRGDSEIVILIDSCKHNYKEDKFRMVEDRCVDLAISTIYYSLNNGMRVTLVYYVEGKQHTVKGNSSGDFKSFMDNLYDFKPISDINICNQIKGISNSVTSGSTVMILTPMLDKDCAMSAIDLREKNFMPHMFIVENLLDEKLSFIPKEISTNLNRYGILVDEINLKNDIRDVLEVKHGQVG